MSVNKVEINGSTVLDLTNDSVTPETLTKGATAHNASGEQIIGTYEAPEEPYIEEIYDSNGNLIDAKLYGYTKIRDYVFYDCRNLAMTSLPEGITSIGDCAFCGCTNLALTSLPEGITSIVQNAFGGCTNLALTSLPEGITKIRIMCSTTAKI